MEKHSDVAMVFNQKAYEQLRDKLERSPFLQELFKHTSVSRTATLDDESFYCFQWNQIKWGGNANIYDFEEFINKMDRKDYRIIEIAEEGDYVFGQLLREPFGIAITRKIIFQSENSLPYSF